MQCQVAAHAADNCSPAMLAALSDLARKHGLTRTIHMAQSKGEVAAVQRAHGLTPAAYLDREGFLGPDLVGAHWTWCGAVQQRSLLKGPLASGGWSAYVGNPQGMDWLNSIGNVGLRAVGEAGFPGWYRSERMEALRRHGPRAPRPGPRHRRRLPDPSRGPPPRRAPRPGLAAWPPDVPRARRSLFWWAAS